MIKDAEWRIPWWIVGLLVLILISVLAWWNGRHYDFLSAPSDNQLQQIRTQTKIELQQNFIPAPDDKVAIITKNQLDTPIADQQINTQKMKINSADLGDFAVLPAIDAYAWIPPSESSKMVALATELESSGQYQRALLAWERVIDHCEANQEQGELALKSIMRLKPGIQTWNVDPTACLPLNIEIAGNKDVLTPLKPNGETWRELINQAGSGILLPNFVWITTTPSDVPNPPVPNATVAITLTGAQPKLMRSKSLMVSIAAKDHIPSEQILLDAIYKLLRDLIRTNANLKAPFAPNATFNSSVLIQNAITRHSWQELGRTMNIKQ